MFHGADQIPACKNLRHNGFLSLDQVINGVILYPTCDLTFVLLYPVTLEVYLIPIKNKQKIGIVHGNAKLALK